MHHGVVNGPGIIKEFSNDFLEGLLLFLRECGCLNSGSHLLFAAIDRWLERGRGKGGIGEGVLELNKCISYVAWHC